jgi:hypothetical protein
MLVLIPAVGTGTALSGSLLWRSWTQAAKRARPAPARVFPQPTGVRILRGPDEIILASRQAADREYRLAATALLRGDHYKGMIEGATGS